MNDDIEKCLRKFTSRNCTKILMKILNGSLNIVEYLLPKPSSHFDGNLKQLNFKIADL